MNPQVQSDAATSDRAAELLGLKTSPGEVQTALTAFASASRKVEDYYRMLQEKVHRLTEDLEKKNRELTKKVSESERMRAMLVSTLQSLTSGVVAVGRDGIIVAANPVACEIFSIALEEVAGRDVAKLLSPIEGAERLLAALFEGESRSERVEWRIEANGHARRTVQLTAVRADPPYDRRLAGLILAEDVTELRRLECRAVLASRLTGMGELAASLAHEIRNPLGSISLHATTLAHELAGDASLAPLADHLVAGVKTLHNVVTNVLEFARPRRLALTRVDLIEILGDTIAFLRHPSEQKNVKLELVSDVGAKRGEQAVAPIAADGEQLRQVFLNLGINALQAVDRGGCVRFEISPLSSGGWEVRIVDDGVGILASDLERIFDPFFTTKEKGSGIGLAVVHQILAAHEAQIEVDSTEGEGTAIRVLFAAEPFLEKKG